MGNTNIKEESYRFAVKIVNIYRNKSVDSSGIVLMRQLLRSGTSIGANVEEANGAQSRKDFIAKMSIAYKESRETRYWISLLKDTGYLSEESSTDLSIIVERICRILAKILLTSKSTNP